MSGRTVVRLAGVPTDEGAFFVDDWDEDGCFTLPVEHPLARHLMSAEACPRDNRLIVASTDEIEWHVTKWSATKDHVAVTCRSHQEMLELWTLPDDYLIKHGMVS